MSDRNIEITLLWVGIVLFNKMGKKTKFSFEEEEKIINFVKHHEILYNVRNKSFRDSEAKNRLWLELAEEELEHEGIYVSSVIITSIDIIYIGGTFSKCLMCKK